VGTTPAPYRALKRFEQAGDLYWPEGYLEGGRFAAFGFHKARDCKTADRLLRAALREELYEAATLLGRLHQGDGVCPSDRDRAIRFFRMGERVRDADATLGLGRALMRRSGDPEASFDPERDRREAVHYLALALSRGDARARPWLDWAIAGVEPPLRPEELAEIRGLQILLDGGGYDLPEGTPPRPNSRQG
jgi:TPR repeat protein